MATQPPQSLPSFAQAFGAPSLTRLADASNALPPIHPRADPHDRLRPSPSLHDDHRQPMQDRPPSSARKRSHPDESKHDDAPVSASDERRSPKSVRIKEESEYDSLPSPSSRPHPSTNDARHALHDSPSPPVPTPNPSPNKKRRVTISGISHPINTDVRTPPTDATKSISPVVMGLPIPRDDAAAIEQVRSMLTIKQQQKELIEQRRGSAAGLVSLPSPAVSVTVPPQDDRPPKGPPPPPRNGRRSPASGPRRSIAGLSGNPPPLNRALSPLARQSSPPPAHPPILQPPPMSAVEQQQQQQQQQQHPQIPAHALPPPPISFARRRATRTLGGGKAKPADIMISPRDGGIEHLQPSIQSAPPIPRASISHGSALPSRLASMALPRLPPVLGPNQPAQRLTVSRVPPTPTRLSVARGPASAHLLNVGSISAAARSPPAASVPIATTLVPPTPSALAHPNYTKEKSAFLAPFEMFFDALADSKTLKNWLNEQLQKSHALTLALQRQQEHLDELVAAAVERRVGPMQEEIDGLHSRIAELEHGHGLQGQHQQQQHQQQQQGGGALRLSNSSLQGYSPGMGPAAVKGKGKANGIGAPPSSSSFSADTYTFPPVEPQQQQQHHHHHHHHPLLVVDREREREAESRSFPGSQTGSPVPFDVGRRLSVSAIRMDPPARGTEGGGGGGAARVGSVPGRLPPPPSASGAGSGSGGWNHGHGHQGNPWSPRGSRTSLPPAPSAAPPNARGSGSVSAHGHGHPAGAGAERERERPGLARRTSAQRLTGPAEGYGAYEGAEAARAESASRERERERENKEREREKERERDWEREVSPLSHPPPLRREVRSPEPMEE